MDTALKERLWHGFTADYTTHTIHLDVDGTATSGAYRIARLVRDLGHTSITWHITTTPETVTVVAPQGEALTFQITDEAAALVHSGDFLDFFELTAHRERTSEFTQLTMPDIDFGLWSRQVAGTILENRTFYSMCYALTTFLMHYRTAEHNQHNQRHTLMDGGLAINSPNMPVIYLDAITDEVIDGDEGFRAREAFDLYQELLTHGAILDHLPVVGQFIQEYGDEDTKHRLASFQREEDTLVEHLGYNTQPSNRYVIINQGMIEHAPKDSLIVDMEELQDLPSDEKSRSDDIYNVYRTYERIVRTAPQLLRDMPGYGIEFRDTIRRYADDEVMRALIKLMEPFVDPVKLFDADNAVASYRKYR